MGMAEEMHVPGFLPAVNVSKAVSATGDINIIDAGGQKIALINPELGNTGRHCG